MNTMACLEPAVSGQRLCSRCGHQEHPARATCGYVISPECGEFRELSCECVSHDVFESGGIGGVIDISTLNAGIEDVRNEQLDSGRDEISVDLKGEQWKALADFRDYEVSNMGRFRRKFDYGYRELTGHHRLRRTDIGGFGWRRIRVGFFAKAAADGKQIRDSAFLDSLVMQAFGPPKPPSSVPIHVDGDVDNCAIDNLRWGAVTRRRHSGEKRGSYDTKHQVGRFRTKEPELVPTADVTSIEDAYRDLFKLEQARTELETKISRKRREINALLGITPQPCKS